MLVILICLKNWDLCNLYHNNREIDEKLIKLLKINVQKEVSRLETTGSRIKKSGVKLMINRQISEIENTR